MRRLRLLCDTNPMAYGSTASLAAILAVLRLEADVVAMGRDVSLELLRSSMPSGRVLELDVKNVREVEPVLASEKPDAVLVVSNQSNLRAYADAGVPVFFVDILFWYGEQKDERTWSQFEQGFALDFPGVRERLAELAWRRPPVVVGPLLRELAPRSGQSFGTLVNLGGVRSVFLSKKTAAAGLAIAAHILRAVSPALPPGDVIVAAGADAAVALRPLLPASVQVGPLSPAEYDAHLQRSAMLLTVPGVNAVLEGMAAEVPLAFLPALNASQCLQLRRYQRAGIAASGVELERYAALEIPERVADEQALTGNVVRALESIASSQVQLEHLTGAVREQLPVSVHLTRRRRTFVDSLGAPGAETIANAIEEWWREHAA